jgi:hypothetical protein
MLFLPVIFLSFIVFSLSGCDVTLWRVQDLPRVLEVVVAEPRHPSPEALSDLSTSIRVWTLP